MSETNKNNIAFLFGAGISQNSLISTDNLTAKVLEGKNIVHLGGRYLEVDNYAALKDMDIRGFVPKIKLLLQIIKDSFSDHYMFDKRGMNYEDYYYMINTLYEDENGEYVNPIVSKYCDDFRNKYKEIFSTKYPEIGEVRLIDITSEALGYIQDIIVANLSNSEATTKHLTFLNEACADASLNRILIFTLNHDVLIESFFKENSDFTDGFVSDGYDYKKWTPSAFAERITLLKVHGSINWYRILGPDYYDDKIGIYYKQVRNGDRPLMLIGSFNKLHAYTRSINFELQCLFAKQLNESNDLIISGYSFGDQGINSRIINWALGSKERKIYLIHKQPDNLIRNARPAIRTNFSFLYKQNKIFHIEEYITEKTSWSEIKKTIS